MTLFANLIFAIFVIAVSFHLMTFFFLEISSIYDCAKFDLLSGVVFQSVLKGTIWRIFLFLMLILVSIWEDGLAPIQLNAECLRVNLGLGNILDSTHRRMQYLIVFRK